MYISISLMAAILAVAAVLWFSRHCDTETRAGMSVLTAMVTFLITILVIFIIASAQSKQSNYTSVQEICSIRNDDTTEGSFFLGSGSIKETQYYFYYIKNGNSSYYLSKMRAIGTGVIEDNDKTPGIYQEMKCITFPGWSGFSSCYIERSVPCIIVPKGTIIKEFNLR